MIGRRHRELKRLKTELHFASREAAEKMVAGESTTKSNKRIASIRASIAELESAPPDILECEFCHAKLVEGTGEYRALQLFHIVHPINGSAKVLQEHLTIPACIPCSDSLWDKYEVITKE